MSVNFNASSTGSSSFTASILPAEVKTTYSSEDFKALLLKSHPFPLNTIVQGNLALSGYTGHLSFPEGLIIEGDLNLSGYTGPISLPERFTVKGRLNLSGCTGLTSLPERLTD